MLDFEREELELFRRGIEIVNTISIKEVQRRLSNYLNTIQVGC